MCACVCVAACAMVFVPVKPQCGQVRGFLKLTAHSSLKEDESEV